MPVRRAIAWLRRDLRLSDNRVLAAATERAERVWPVFVVDPAMLEAHRSAAPRVAWFDASVQALDARLREAGSGLLVERGPPDVVIPALARRLEADLVVAARDEDPVAVARDGRVARAVELELVEDTRILPPGAVRTSSGDAFAVYTPFRRALDARLATEGTAATAAAEVEVSRLAPPGDGGQPPPFADGAAGIALPDAGEEAAVARLRAFLRHDLPSYADGRDIPGDEVTSRISPYLRVGAISVRAAWRAATNAAARASERGDRRLARSAERWRGELAWREFFAQVLAAHPRLADESYRRELDGLSWARGRSADRLVDAWRTGRTGFPLVDAGMRELTATGWMHNRARLVTASFLVKDIGVDWRVGERVFMEHLLDGDLAQNNGNWQWVAGVGTDAAPYFRILNPTLQARRFDPDGTYIRSWVPELRDLDDRFVHEPWRAPRPPVDYPSPILDHAAARRETLERYARAGSG